MFSVIIKGRTMMELRTNLAIFLAGMDDFTVPSKGSQVAEMTLDNEDCGAEQSATAHIPDAPPFTMPHIPAHLAQSIEPARSIPTSVSSALPPTTTTPTTPANDFGFDSKNLPWDSRIHAVTQGVNKDGTWRYRRGIEKSLIDQVEAELRIKTGMVPANAQTPAQVMASPVAPPVPFAPPASPSPSLAMVPPLQQAPQVMAQPEPKVQVSAPPPPQNLSMHSLETFKANLPMTLTKLVMEGKLPQSYIEQLKAYFKVEQIWQVNADQAAEMFQTFCESGVLVKA